MFTALATTTASAGIAAAHWGGPWAGGGGFGWLFLLIPLFWIAVFVLLFTFIGRRRMRAFGPGYGYGRGYGHPGYGHPGLGAPGDGTRSAEQTLAERFAQGDIDEVEYRARLEVIRASRSNGA
jgi:putative membrane protein